MSDLLREKLSIVGRKSVFVNVGAGSCLAFTALLAAIGAGMLIDWLLELPYLIRTLLLAIDLAMLITLLIREVAGPLLNRPDEDEVALWVEQSSPGLRSRLIAAIQLTRAEAVGTGGGSLVQALVRETEEITAPLDFQSVVKSDRFVRYGAMAALAVLLGIATLAVGRQASVDLFERAMLVPGVDVPRKTRVEVIGGNQIFVARGEPIELRAQAKGIIPTDGSIRLTYDSDKHTVTMKMPADPQHPGEFAAKLETVADSFTYCVFLNDGHSADCRVEATFRPSVSGLEIRQIFPDYTHLQPVKRAPGDLQLLAGSKLALRVTANKPVKLTDGRQSPFNRATLHSKTGITDFPLVTDKADPHFLASAVEISLAPDTVGLSIHLVDENGLETRDPAVYRIEQIPDSPPTVRVTFPDRREQLSTAGAKLVVGVEASDDFAIGKLALCYKVVPPETAESLTDQINVNAAATPGATAPTANLPTEQIDFDLKGTPKDFRGRFPFELSKLKTIPVEHGAVEWWLEAEDTNTVTGPGKAASDHYLTRIASEAEVRADLFLRLGNHMAQLKEQSETLKQDNAELGEMIQEKVGAGEK